MNWKQVDKTIEQIEFKSKMFEKNVEVLRFSKQLSKQNC